MKRIIMSERGNEWEGVVSNGEERMGMRMLFQGVELCNWQWTWRKGTSLTFSLSSLANTSESRVERRGAEFERRGEEEVGGEGGRGSFSYSSSLLLHPPRLSFFTRITEGWRVKNEEQVTGEKRISFFLSPFQKEVRSWKEKQVTGETRNEGRDGDHL